MNPGISEEVGHTARTIVESFKSAPAVLALVLFNLAFIGVVAYIQHANGERWQALLETTLKQCAPHQ